MIKDKYCYFCYFIAIHSPAKATATHTFKTNSFGAHGSVPLTLGRFNLSNGLEGNLQKTPCQWSVSQEKWKVYVAFGEECSRWK